MSWNFRVFKTRHRLGLIDEVSFDIREVYYDDNGSIDGITMGGSYPMGNTLDELQCELEKMTLACEKPVLTPKDIPNYEYGEHEVDLDS